VRSSTPRAKGLIQMPSVTQSNACCGSIIYLMRMEE
jgi:hypothetical protein